MNFISNLYRINKLLDKKDKFLFLILSFFTLIGLLLEVLGIAMIIPIISVTISPSDIEFFSNLNLNKVSVYFGFSSLIYFLLVSLLILFFIKMIFFVGLGFFQKTYVSKLINKISNNLYEKYIDQDLSFYNEKNKSEIIQNLQSETYYLFLFFESLLTLITDALLVLLFVCFIAFYNPEGFLFLFTYFGIAFMIYLFLTKSKSFRWGKRRSELDDEISKMILESFGFIKQILINESKNYFISNFDSKNNLKYRYISYRLTLDQIPKIYFEFVTVLFIVIYTFFLYNSNDQTNLIVTKLGILVAISYKIIPSLSKISVSFQTIKNTLTSLLKIYNELENVTCHKTNLIRNFKNKIEFKKLGFAHNDSSKTLIENINIQINKNKITGFFGGSGVGKTTILDIISGLHHNFKGEFFIDNKLIDQKKFTWRPKVSYVSQDTFIFNDSIENNIIISRAGEAFNENKFIEALKKAQIYDWVKTLDNKQKTKISHEGSNISGGQKQRIGLARAIYKDSDIFIFDEPTSSLDIQTEKEIMKTIYDLKGLKTIIIVSHNVSSLSGCDQIIELK